MAAFGFEKAMMIGFLTDGWEDEGIREKFTDEEWKWLTTKPDSIPQEKVDEARLKTPGADIPIFVPTHLHIRCGQDPDAWKVIKRITDLIEKEMEKDGNFELIASGSVPIAELERERSLLDSLKEVSKPAKKPERGH